MAIGIQFHAPVTFSGGVSGVVASLAKSGSAALTGAVTLTGGTNVTLTQAGNDISIAAAGGGGGSGYTEVSYTPFTADVNITATAEGSANTIVTAPAFTADGTSAYLIEFFSTALIPGNTAGRNITIVLYQDGSSIGRMGSVQTPASAFALMPLHSARRLVPAAGSRTYSARGIVNAGTGIVSAGAGGSGNQVPGFIRITKVT